MKYKTMTHGLTVLFGLTIVISIVIILKVYVYKDNDDSVKHENSQKISTVVNSDYKSQMEDTPEYKEIVIEYKDKIRYIMKDRFKDLTLEDFKRLHVIKEDLKEDNVPSDRVVYSTLKDGRIIIGYFDKDNEDYVDIYKLKE